MFLNNLFSSSSERKTKPVVLVVCDGWGVAPDSDGNAIVKAKPKFFNEVMMSKFPNSILIASGESVGLPANVVGTSEVGHLTIGVGRVIDESLVRINRSIDDNKLSQNEAFIKASSHALSTGGKLHLIGMVSSGSVHSSIKHLYSLIDFAVSQHIPKIVLHLFTDGRDAPPTNGKSVLEALRERIAPYPSVTIGSISGRYFGMDRDARWERTQKVYEVLLGIEQQPLLIKNVIDYVSECYKNGQTDEFIPPARVEGDVVVNDNDSIIFFNFRADRARQLVMPFALRDFESINSIEWGFDIDQGNTNARKSSGPTFQRKKIVNNACVVTMTEYQSILTVSAVAFPPENITSSITEVFSKMGLRQLHLAESEKERMVSFYFDGLKNKLVENEDLKIVASPKVATYDLRPQMSASKIVGELRKALNKDIYSFVVINFANADMVAHTGNLKATISAIKTLDNALKDVWDVVRKFGGTMLMTADHGNAEELISYRARSYYFTSDSGEVNTEHSNNPVPFVIMKEEYFGNEKVKLDNGMLSDVAPTILSLMGIQVPEQMTGKNLLRLLN